MIENTKELQSCKAKNSRRIVGVQIRNASLTDVVMSGAAVIIWFLLSQNVKSMGTTVLLSSVVLLSFDTLIFFILKSAHSFRKISAVVAIAVLNAVVFLSISIYVLAPTQLFFPHFDEES